MYEVEKVVAKKVVNGVVSYKVKWKGYNNKHNVWRQVSELDCDGLIEPYGSRIRLLIRARQLERVGDC